MIVSEMTYSATDVKFFLGGGRLPSLLPEPGSLGGLSATLTLGLLHVLPVNRPRAPYPTERESRRNPGASPKKIAAPTATNSVHSRTVPSTPTMVSNGSARDP